MTKTEGRTASAAVKDILLSNPDGLREVIRTVMQEVLEAEMDEALGAAKGEARRSGSASSISAINKRLDESLKAFAERSLQEPFAYLVLDARYEKVREAGVVMSQAVLIAVGIDWDGRRQILSVEMAGRESRCAWKDFLVRLKGRGLKGVELVSPTTMPVSSRQLAR